MRHWRVAFVALACITALCTGGCTCTYNVASRDLMLARPITNAETEFAVRSVAKDDELFITPADPERRVSFFFASPEPAQIRFSRPPPGGGPGNAGWMHYAVTHHQPSAHVRLEARIVGISPTEQARERALAVFDQLEAELHRVAGD